MFESTCFNKFDSLILIRKKNCIEKNLSNLPKGLGGVCFYKYSLIDEIQDVVDHVNYAICNRNVREGNFGANPVALNKHCKTKDNKVGN